MDKKNIAIIVLSLALIALIARTWYVRDYTQIMAVTGATPLAINKDAPCGLSLKVTGMLKKQYEFGSRAFNAFAPTRIRTREVSPAGAFEGTYIYNGIPLFNILEGVAPKKSKTAAFDRPLDMVVKVISSSGKTSLFSYGELTMTDDRHPVTLAFYRSELKPTKDPEKYDKNIHHGPIKGLRLVCPKDTDTGRYLDDVVEISLGLLPSPDAVLPAMKKGAECSAASLTCISGEKTAAASFAGVESASKDNWVRVGHGRGYKSISSLAGYSLRGFLRKNFPGCGPDDFFLFVACDGYRCLFSGREIFSTEDGEGMLLAREIDGKKPSGNNMLAPADDYFVDRDIWGLSHIAVIKAR